nr:MAG TPA: hypothetical protein [Caudoviricetes sp.]
MSYSNSIVRIVFALSVYALRRLLFDIQKNSSRRS